MSEFLAKFNGGELIALTAVLIGPLVAIVAIVSAHWRRVRLAELESALKQTMLDKGMSVNEMEKVLAASPNGATGNSALDRAALAQHMVDNGYEGADIERVLRAYQPSPEQQKAVSPV
jgi:hypothetical protein